jgi:DNA-binding protein Fis
MKPLFRSHLDRDLYYLESELTEMLQRVKQMRSMYNNHLAKEDVDEYALCSLDEVKAAHIFKVLKICRGNQSKTARMLGIHPKTLNHMVKRFSLICPRE